MKPPTLIRKEPDLSDPAVLKKEIKEFEDEHYFPATGPEIPALPDKHPLEQLAEYLNSYTRDIYSFPSEKQYVEAVGPDHVEVVMTSYDIIPTEFPEKIAGIRIFLWPMYQSPPKGLIDRWTRRQKIKHFREHYPAGGRQREI